MDSKTSPPPVRRWWNTPEFLRSLPLFVLAALFFIAGAVLRLAYPTYALYGPGVFTFWALLLALGFTCSIGGVVSWTLAGDAPATPTPTETAAPSPAYLPIDFPEPDSPTASPEPSPPGRERSVFGRPAPDIRPAAANADFYEGPTDRERYEAPKYLLPLEVQPNTEPVEKTSDEPEPVEKVLADLERIERELAPRARVVEPTST
jgi:hypothetical protein